MKCFHFFSGEKKERQMVKRKMSSISHDTRRSGSEFNSLNVSDASADSSQRPPLPSSFQSSNNLRVFMFPDMKGATKNFSHSLIVGQGGFGCVFRGSIKSLEDPRTRIEVAIKQLSHRGLQGHKEWLTEVNFLGVVEHPNLVKLVGYCAEDDERGTQRLLVYEFMSNGSVQDHLSSRSTTPLSWAQRLRVALDAARGLTYLHEEMEFQIIFRDLKTSNILLDEHWNAKLSDFGLARQGPVEGLSHVSTAVVGTVGYAAPEYIHTGRLTAKSDIWSYGVVLYELVTGRRPMDRNRPKSEQKLLEWIKPYISDPKKFPMIIDPRLVGVCSPRSAMKLAAIANKCLVRNPKSRPKVSEVVKMVQSIIESEERGTPEIPLRSSTLDDEKSQEKKRAVNLKGRIGEFKMGGFVLKKLAPELLRTH